MAGHTRYPTSTLTVFLPWALLTFLEHLCMDYEYRRDSSLANVTFGNEVFYQMKSNNLNFRFQSHQIFHILVLIGALIHYRNITYIALFRLSEVNFISWN